MPLRRLSLLASSVSALRVTTTHSTSTATGSLNFHHSKNDNNLNKPSTAAAATANSGKKLMAAAAKNDTTPKNQLATGGKARSSKTSSVVQAKRTESESDKKKSESDKKSNTKTSNKSKKNLKQPGSSDPESGSAPPPPPVEEGSAPPPPVAGSGDLPPPSTDPGPNHMAPGTHTSAAGVSSIATFGANDLKYNNTKTAVKKHKKYIKPMKKEMMPEDDARVLEVLLSTRHLAAPHNYTEAYTMCNNFFEMCASNKDDPTEPLDFGFVKENSMDLSSAVPMELPTKGPCSEVMAFYTNGFVDPAAELDAFTYKKMCVSVMFDKPEIERPKPKEQCHDVWRFCAEDKDKISKSDFLQCDPIAYYIDQGFVSADDIDADPISVNYFMKGCTDMVSLTLHGEETIDTASSAVKSPSMKKKEEEEEEKIEKIVDLHSKSNLKLNTNGPTGNSIIAKKSTSQTVINKSNKKLNKNHNHDHKKHKNHSLSRVSHKSKKTESQILAEKARLAMGIEAVEQGRQEPDDEEGPGSDSEPETDEEGGEEEEGTGDEEPEPTESIVGSASDESDDNDDNVDTAVEATAKAAEETRAAATEASEHTEQAVTETLDDISNSFNSVTSTIGVPLELPKVGEIHPETYSYIEPILDKEGYNLWTECYEAVSEKGDAEEPVLGPVGSEPVLEEKEKGEKEEFLNRQNMKTVSNSKSKSNFKKSNKSLSLKKRKSDGNYHFNQEPGMDWDTVLDTKECEPLRNHIYEKEVLNVIGSDKKLYRDVFHGLFKNYLKETPGADVLHTRSVEDSMADTESVHQCSECLDNCFDFTRECHDEASSDDSCTECDACQNSCKPGLIAGFFRSSATVCIESCSVLEHCKTCKSKHHECVHQSTAYQCHESCNNNLEVCPMGYQDDFECQDCYKSCSFSLEPEKCKYKCDDRFSYMENVKMNRQLIAENGGSAVGAKIPDFARVSRGMQAKLAETVDANIKNAEEKMTTK